MFKNFQKIKRSVAVICLLGITAMPLAIIPEKANAALGGGVPISTSWDYNNIMDHSKNFTLDAIAVTVANQIIQRMTASVVEWINSGFDGNPSFLTNPEGFFLDVGDQITGEFLQQLGIPDTVCSPFSFDINIALALNRVDPQYNPYKCTLSKIVESTQASIDRGVGVHVVNDPNGMTLGDIITPGNTNLLNNPDVVNVNGSSLNQFYQGEFRAGGWPTFFEAMMVQQNNPNGLYLKAQSDLNQKIAARRAAVETDLNRGKGFLSWQKCTDIATAGDSAVDSSLQNKYGLDNNQVAQLNSSDKQIVNTANGSSIRKSYDKNTKVTKYQECKTQTPGSVIGNSLQKQLDLPVDKLALVKTISDSIDAITSALVNQMLSQGLNALSSKSSGGGSGRSYLQQIADEANARDSLSRTTARAKLAAESQNLIALLENATSTYEQSITALNGSRANLFKSRQCLEGKASYSSAAVRYIDEIDLLISSEIDSQIIALRKRQVDAAKQVDVIKANSESATAESNITEQTSDDIRYEVEKFQTFVGAFSDSTQYGVGEVTTAQTNKTGIEKDIEYLDAQAVYYQKKCNNIYI